MVDQAPSGSHPTEPPRVEAKPPFWTSIPGILTGVAALITAIVGAVTLVLTAGNNPQNPNPTSSPSEVTEVTDEPPTESATTTTLTPPVEATIAAGGHGYEAYIYASPSLSSPIVGTVPHGTTVSIVCTAYGDSVASPDGSVTTYLWDFIKPGGPVSVGGYVADTWVFTGTNDPTMPACD